MSARDKVRDRLNERLLEEQVAARDKVRDRLNERLLEEQVALRASLKRREHMQQIAAERLPQKPPLQGSVGAAEERRSEKEKEGENPRRVVQSEARQTEEATLPTPAPKTEQAVPRRSAAILQGRAEERLAEEHAIQKTPKERLRLSEEIQARGRAHAAGFNAETLRGRAEELRGEERVEERLAEERAIQKTSRVRLRLSEEIQARESGHGSDIHAYEERRRKPQLIPRVDEQNVEVNNARTGVAANAEAAPSEPRAQNRRARKLAEELARLRERKPTAEKPLSATSDEQVVRKPKDEESLPRRTVRPAQADREQEPSGTELPRARHKEENDAGGKAQENAEPASEQKVVRKPVQKAVPKPSPTSESRSNPRFGEMSTARMRQRMKEPEVVPDAPARSLRRRTHPSKRRAVPPPSFTPRSLNPRAVTSHTAASQPARTILAASQSSGAQAITKNDTISSSAGSIQTAPGSEPIFNSIATPIGLYPSPIVPLPALNTVGSFVVDQDMNAVALRGVNASGFDTLTSAQTAASDLELDETSLAVLSQLWGLNMVRIPFQAETIMSGNGTLAAPDVLAALDQIVAQLTQAGMYALLAIEATPAAAANGSVTPDPNTSAVLQTLATYFNGNTTVLYEVFATIEPLGPDWPQAAAVLIGAIRSQAPAAMIFVNSGNGGFDYSALPLLFPTGDAIFNIVYTIGIAPGSQPVIDEAVLASLTAQSPVCASIWLDDESRLSPKIGDVFGRYGIHWAASNWNADPLLVAGAAIHDFSPTGWGMIAQRAATFALKLYLQPSC